MDRISASSVTVFQHRAPIVSVLAVHRPDAGCYRDYNRLWCCHGAQVCHGIYSR